ncbi:hypothetical protein VTO42DRAFT_6328 [Malbranchea cinnamomea]
MPIPIIDSHIHLWAASHLETLAWHTHSNPLGSQHSISEYRQATASASKDPSTSDATYLKGFVFLETDRISSLAPSDWNHALDEVSFLTRIAAGTPIEGEGHEPADRDLCLAIVPWAPVAAGPEALREYMAKVRERTQTDEIFKKVTGVRYLVQDKPSGTMLGDGFVEGLKWLGQQGLVFDLGVDARQGGLWQLEEAVEMLSRVYAEQKSAPKVVINHMCKPNLRLKLAPAELLQHPDYTTWKGHVESLSRFPATYMKLSGLFSELPPLPQYASDEEESELIASIVSDVAPWVDVIFYNFGPHRVMFGSDWPVCNVGGGGNQVTWGRWRKVVEALLERRGLSEEEKREVWGGVAGRVYGCSP